MEKPDSTAQEIERVPEAVKPKKSLPLLSIVASVLLVAAGAGAYWWRNDQAVQQKKSDSDKISQLQKQVDDIKKQLAAAKESNKSADSSAAADSAKTVDATPNAADPTPSIPTAAVKENIIASITSGNTAALEGYMASSVHVVYAASSGVFDHTPSQAVTDIKYLDSAVAPWDFALPAATLSGYSSGGYKEYFKTNSIVGKSSDGKVIVFNFNDAGKINAVFMSVSADLL